MKERPIYPYAHEVRAILDGRQTMLRRIVKPQPFKPDPSRPSYFPFQPDDWVWCANSWSSTISNSPEGPAGWSKHCPYGQPGDRLWVKESIRRIGEPSDGDERLCESEYIADGTRTAAYCWPWENKALPSIHCPRSLSRITLEIVSVRVERLQAISEADAISEGVTAVSSGGVTLFATTGVNCSAKDAYAALWESINGPGSWDANPWVWCISFKVI